MISCRSANKPQRVYLITYSQADLQKFPTRESFGHVCAEAFGGNKVLYFACAKEPHEQTSGYHYHVALRLEPPQKWKTAKQYLESCYKITVNFGSSEEGMYAGAYKYCAKHDKDIIHSGCLEKHPNLDMIGKNKVTEKANKTYREKRKSVTADKENHSSTSTSLSSKNVKHRRIDKLDVVEYIRNNNIKTPLQLMAEAESRRQVGDRERGAFILKLNGKVREELIEDAWQMHNALSKVQKLKTQRMSHVKSFLEKACEKNCNGLWLNCALDILKKNEINRYVFADALKSLLTKGRGKHRNIILVGEGDCGKTFLLNPISAILPEIFSNPASSCFSWMRVAEAQAIILNDFPWKPMHLKGSIIDWDALLRLLEGTEVNLPAPMNSHAKHIKLTSDVPIFATSSTEIRFYKQFHDEPETLMHRTENAMMASRWNVFHLKYRFTQEEKISDIPNCGHCFAKLVFLGCEDDLN